MKLAKAMSMALACAMAATMCATSAFAATSGSTKVNATVTPSYTLTVPESITLTNTAGKTAAVTVSNQTKSKWSRADLLNDGTSATCKVSAELDPGHWTGTATFSCEKTYK